MEVSEIEDWLRKTPISIDDFVLPLEFTKEEIEMFYLPLAENIIGRRRKNYRTLVAIAGPPGSGKTVLGNILVRIINSILNIDHAVLIGLDGWHYPNCYLESQYIELNGKITSLSNIKGSPETYDTKAIELFLQKASGTSNLSYPIYSRKVHDPIENVGCLIKDHQIIVFEGNYWLLDEEPWSSFYKYWSFSVFINVEAEIVFQDLLDRHIRGGKTERIAREHINQVDLPNTQRIHSHRLQPDLVVHKKDRRYFL